MSADDDRVLKSYVWHKGQCFFVSTIERDSSAMLGPRRFNETMVWKYDWDKRARDEHIFAQEEDARGSIWTHQKVVQQLYKDGQVPTED
jgi:hypothetical protein